METKMKVAEEELIKLAEKAKIDLNEYLR